MSDSVTNYNYVGDTKVSVSISQRFNSSKRQVLQTYNLPVKCNNSNLVSDQSKPLGHLFRKRHSPKKSPRLV